MIYAPTEDISDDAKDSFYGELEREVYQFPKHTWTSPDGKMHNQNYHVLADKGLHSNIVDVNIFRGADCDTDHYLLIAKVRQTVSK
jgi:hypothetical protein